MSAYRDKIVRPEYLEFSGIETMLSFRNKSTLSIIGEQLPAFVHQNKLENNKYSQHNPRADFIIKKCPALKLRHKMITNIKARAEAGVPTFREFALHAVVSVLRCGATFECKTMLDTHITPVVQFCNPCMLPLDFIMKVSIVVYPHIA